MSTGVPADEADVDGDDGVDRTPFEPAQKRDRDGEAARAEERQERHLDRHPGAFQEPGQRIPGVLEIEVQALWTGVLAGCEITPLSAHRGA